jgi:hypothetical protein
MGVIFYTAFLLKAILGRTDISADLILTSLGSDEAVEEVYAKLFKGQEVSLYVVRLELGLYQDQDGKGDGIVPGGKGRSTIFIDTSTVSGRILRTTRPLMSGLPRHRRKDGTSRRVQIPPCLLVLPSVRCAGCR